MSFRTRRFGILLAAAMLAGTALVGAVAGAEPRAGLDPAATRVVGQCKAGNGKVALTVLPIAVGSYEVELNARRVREGSRWRVGLTAFSEGAGEVAQRFRRRAVDGSWSITTKVSLEGDTGQAAFLLDARRVRDGVVGGFFCSVSYSPGNSGMVGYGMCGKGFNELFLRQRDDGTLVVRYHNFGRAPDTRWRLSLIVNSAEASQRVIFDDLSSPHGVLRSRVMLTAVPDNPVFTMRAESERGAYCRLRINPPTALAAAVNN